MDLRISLETNICSGTVDIPSSKSISNRVLLLDALAHGSGTLSNLSEARDTELMRDLLMSEHAVMNAKDAGTTYRFLTSYLAIQEGRTSQLLGEERMYKRPIGILVDGLRELGADIQYIGEEGFPPLLITGKNLKSKGLIKLDGSISSQFLSSLIMVGPYIENGLKIELVPPVASEPYLRMTLELMKEYGASLIYDGRKIQVEEGTYCAIDHYVETDWSGACFFYALSTLCDAEFAISNLYEESLQADRAIASILKSLGVHTEYSENGISIHRSTEKVSEEIDVDCLMFPDLVPALTVAISMLGIKGTLYHTTHLQYKESDRALALKNELEKTGVEIINCDGTMTVRGTAKVVSETIFDSYRDHRMAMCLSLLAVRAPIVIKDAEVVEKSFPNYWQEMQKLGFTITEL